MVPGSTLIYGSNFWSRTRKPRCSRSMPMDAQVSPLPRELTTPPVTKICLATPPPICAFGVRRLVAALGFSDRAGAKSESGDQSPHSKIQKPTGRRGLVPGCHYSKGARGVESGGERRHECLVLADELLVVGGGIDAAGRTFDKADVNAPAQGENAELFEL